MKKKYKVDGKFFRTKYAKIKYISWKPILKKAKKDKVPKTTIKMIKSFQRSWVGK